jgi:lipid A 3-O-deacylase
LKIKLALSLILYSLTSNADQVSFSFYNDFFAGSDKHFSNGAALSWLDDNDDSSNYTNFVLGLADTLHVDLDKSKRYNAGVSLSQITITPDNTELSTAQYDDMPYAGYLALSTFLLQWDDKSFNEYSIEIGVVGKESMAEYVQKTFHHLVDNDEPNGWDTQLKTQYTVNLLLQYGEKTWEHQSNNSLSADWFNHFGATIGNFYTSAFAGTAFRIGKNYVQNFNTHYPYLKDEASLLGLDKSHKGFGWSLNGGIDTQLLAYSYILDEANHQGYDSDKNILSASLYFGGDLYYFNHKLSLFYQSQSPYTKGEYRTDFFGGIVYAYQF